MSVESPLNDGIIEDWDLIDKLWEHASGNFGVELKRASVMMTEKSYAPLDFRKK